MDAKLLALDAASEAAVKQTIAYADDYFKNRRVRLKKGQHYKGRLGVCDGCIISYDGKLRVLVYVLSLRDGSRLNSNTESRRYWLLEDLELVD